jgi:hypothetical protein
MTSEKSLSARSKILDNSEGSSGENNFIIVLAKIEARFVPISSKAINMVNLPGDIWCLLDRSLFPLLWYILIDALKEVLNFTGSHSTALNLWSLRGSPGFSLLVLLLLGFSVLLTLS